MEPSTGDTGARYQDQAPADRATWLGRAPARTRVGGVHIGKFLPTSGSISLLGEHFPPFAIQLLIEAPFALSHEALEAALAKAAAANPGARLVADQDCWIDSGISPRVRIISPPEPFSSAHAFFTDAFTFGSTPPIEAVYCPGSGLAFRCSHALMDAGGLIFFSEETFRALRGEPLLGTRGEFSDRDYLAALKHRTARPFLWPDRPSPLGATLPGKTGFVRERRRLREQVPAAGARMASALAGMSGHLHPGVKSRIMLPVDLRKLDPSVRSASNLSNPIFLQPVSASWVDAYCRILQAIERHDERAISNWDLLVRRIPQPILGSIFRWLHRRQVDRNRYLLSAAISHVGQVSLRAFSVAETAAESVALLPFDAPGAAITLISVQHENGLEISASCPAATGGDGRLSAALDRLCAGLVHGSNSKPASRLSPLPYVPMEGRCMESPPGLTIHALFAQQVNQHPRRSALSEAGIALSYGELERLSILYAKNLWRQGVRARDKVALLSGGGAQSVIALLAILRLGAALVPLDPGWPRERIRLILEDCQPACLLVDEKHKDIIDIAPCLQFADLESESQIDLPDAPAISSPPFPCYVLYTSGSTGRPKGVLVGERSLLNYLLWAGDAYLSGLPEPAAFPLFTSLAFDLTLTSIFLPLANGGEIRVFPAGGPAPRDSRDPRRSGSQCRQADAFAPADFRGPGNRKKPAENIRGRRRGASP